MSRIMLRVAYDGTEYSGWQVQPNAVTIEGELNEALSQLTKESIQVIGASRTDAGVHSLGNVCVFDTETSIPAEKICYAVNNMLPGNIRVIESKEVEADFHPRHCDSVKTYEYKIWNDIFPSPVLSRYAHFTYRKIDLDKMKVAAEKLVGTHDFGAFCGAGSQAETTVRTIYGIDITTTPMEMSVTSQRDRVYSTEQTAFDEQIERVQEKTQSDKNDQTSIDDYSDKDSYEFGKMIHIRVKGSGFLYNMVRIIAGTLLDIGTGIMEVEDIDKCLENHQRSDAGPTAPANGLTMIGIAFSADS